MKKIFNIFIIFLSFLLINWSKQNSNAKLCYGNIFLANGDKEELVDVKIGTSTEFNSNHNIIVFRQPKNTKTNPKNYIEYLVDLDKIAEIDVAHEDSIYKFESDEYIKIKINFLNQSTEDYLIARNKKIIGKVKKNGIVAAYNFDAMNKLVMEKCKEREDN